MVAVAERTDAHLDRVTFAYAHIEIIICPVIYGVKFYILAVIKRIFKLITHCSGNSRPGKSAILTELQAVSIGMGKKRYAMSAVSSL